MKLIINGNETDVAGELTVSGLLDHLDIQPGRVAVEVNMTIIKKAEFDAHQLKEGDTVEIVNFVGGG